jgi:hypothetical protein
VLTLKMAAPHSKTFAILREERKNAYIFRWGKREDLGVDGRIIVNWILQKEDGLAWVG